MFGHHSPRDPETGLTEEDLSELCEAGLRIAAEYAIAAPSVLAATLERLLQRQVPVHSLSRRDDPDASFHLWFADGTGLVVASLHHGDLGWVAVAALQHRLRLVGYRRVDGGVRLEVGDGHRVVVLQATGLDR